MRKCVTAESYNRHLLYLLLVSHALSANHSIESRIFDEIDICDKLVVTDIYVYVLFSAVRTASQKDVYWQQAQSWEETKVIAADPSNRRATISAVKRRPTSDWNSGALLSVLYLIHVYRYELCGYTPEGRQSSSSSSSSFFLNVTCIGHMQVSPVCAAAAVNWRAVC